MERLRHEAGRAHQMHLSLRRPPGPSFVAIIVTARRRHSALSAPVVQDSGKRLFQIHLRGPPQGPQTGVVPHNKRFVHQADSAGVVCHRPACCRHGLTGRPSSGTSPERSGPSGPSPSRRCRSLPALPSGPGARAPAPRPPHPESPAPPRDSPPHIARPVVEVDCG
jgi:hypothetical protein